MTFSNYWELINDRKYFDIFLEHHNSKYRRPFDPEAIQTMPVPSGCTKKQWQSFLSDQLQQCGEEHEKKYRRLIQRYYAIGQERAGSPNVVRDASDLISDQAHVKETFESLGSEFGMNKRSASLSSFDKEYWPSIHTHKQMFEHLLKYRMDGIDPSNISTEVLEGLKVLFFGLKVVPPTQRTKLVAVSKTLHFLLPDLVMPIDSKVLRFIGKGEIPSKLEKQFEWFKEVFNKYIELTAKLGLKQSNGDGNWWNISVPKRIDNAIMGFWDLFNDENRERIICSHIDTLLDWLKAMNQNV
jgi:hypothetical protein